MTQLSVVTLTTLNYHCRFAIVLSTETKKYERQPSVSIIKRKEIPIYVSFQVS